ncbi:MAG: hypothetical protein AAGA48_13700 [Myxococcota bacterium]
MNRWFSRVALFSVLVACQGDVTFGDDAEQAQVPAARPPEVISQTDTITQVTTPAVDILFVIDNSCSMDNNQAQLSENFPTFMEFFEGSGLDYHIGAVSTDVDNSVEAGILRESEGLRFITPNVPDASLVFNGMARLGTSGSGIEQGLASSYTMLELKRDAPQNEGFYRDDASLHVVTISDENDQTPDSLISLGEYIRWYDGLKSSLDERSFSSIVCFPNCVVYITESPGTRYLEVTDQIGGVEADIQNEAWASVLERLGIQASGLKREYFLSQTPVADTIEVVVLRDTGAPQPTKIGFDRAVFDESEPPVLISGEWTYDETRNSITFQNFLPDPLDRIQVTYTLLSATQGSVEVEPK